MERYKCAIPPGGVQALGYACSMNPHAWPERQSLLTKIVPHGYTARDLESCAPRNFILRRPSAVGRYPPEFMQLAIRGLQGKCAPLSKICTPKATTMDVAFCIEDDDSLRYKAVVDQFNKDHADITEHVFFSDLLLRVFEANGFPFAAENLGHDTPDKGYAAAAKQAKARWKQTMAARQAAASAGEPHHRV